MHSRSDSLDTPTMLAALKRKKVDGLHVEVFDALPSTSEYLSQILKTEGSRNFSKPQLCVADWQTNGNGRRGKSWVTERGNITFSMLLSMTKPPSELMGLSLVTGICVAESLRALAAVSAQLKWPNDVLVNDKKVCGLLTEISSSESLATNVIVGVGINYTPPAKMDASDFAAVSVPMLCDSPPSRAELIADVCARVINEYDHFQINGWSVFADRWDHFDYLKGREVRVISANAEQRAIAVGVDQQGALLIESDGITRAVFGGDVSMRLT